ncbi:unnamed protein product [Brassica oleracea]
MVLFGVFQCFDFTQVEPVISVKDTSILYDVQIQSHRVTWSYDQRIWDPGISYSWRNNESVQEEPPWCVTVGEIEDDGQSQVWFLLEKSVYWVFRNQNCGLVMVMQPQWNMRPWFQAEGTSLLLYGHVGIIVENSQPQFLFCSKESVFWILYRNLYLNWELANDIQQKELMLTMFMLRYVDWSFISKMIAECENRTRLNMNAEKTTDKLDILYEAWISKEASCTKSLQLLFSMSCSCIIFMYLNVSFIKLFM